MRNVNRITLIGYVGKDPESFVKDEFKKVSFSLATSDSWKDKVTGEIKSYTVWHDIVVMDREDLFNMIISKVKKGGAVYVEGKLDQRSYTDKEGHERKHTYIKISRFEGQVIPLDKNEQAAHSETTPSHQVAYEPTPIQDDEIPF